MLRDLVIAYGNSQYNYGTDFNAANPATHSRHRTATKQTEDALLTAIAALEAEKVRLQEYPVIRLVASLKAALAREGEMFKPGRMHHNGPRRVSIELDVNVAKRLIEILPPSPTGP